MPVESLLWLSFIRSMPGMLELFIAYFVLPGLLKGIHIDTSGWPANRIRTILRTARISFRSRSTALTPHLLPGKNRFHLF